MSRLNLLGLALCGALCMASLTCRSADLALVSAAQPRPGEVVARVSLAGDGGLRAGELALRLDGEAPVPAAALAAAPASATVLLLCLDRSGSMGAAAVAAMQSALRESLAPRAGEARLPFSVAIVAFGTRATHLLGPSDDPALAADAIDRLRVERERDGRTRLYDAVAGGLAELRATDAPVRRLLVVSDGNDEGSDIPQAALVRRAAAPPSIAVDAVGFGSLAASSSGSLSTLAGATGGRFAVAGTQAELAAVLRGMVREVAASAQYDVTFRYAAAADGRIAESPALLYRPRDGAAVALPLRTGLVAAAAAGTASAALAASAPGQAPAPAASAVAVTSESTLKWLFELGVNFPQLPWILGGLVLALLLLFGLARLRHHQGQAAPPPVPGPAPVGPTEVRPPTVVPPPPPPSGARQRRDTLVAFRWPLPGESRTVAVLRIASGPMRTRQFTLATAQMRLGTAADNDLVIEGDDYVSGHHALLRAETGGLYLADLGSANGTDLNGSRFRDDTRSLSPNDRFTLGRTTIEVLAADAPQSGPGYEQRVR